MEEAYDESGVEQRVGDGVEQVVVVDGDESSVVEQTIESADDEAWVVEQTIESSGRSVGDVRRVEAERMVEALAYDGSLVGDEQRVEQVQTGHSDDDSVELELVQLVELVPLVEERKIASSGRSADGDVRLVGDEQMAVGVEEVMVST